MDACEPKKPIHYDEDGMAWPDDLWQHRKAQRLKAEREEKEHNDKMLIRVTMFGVIVTLIVGIAGFWAAYEAHKTRINDERPFVGFDAVERLTNGQMQDAGVYNSLEDSPSVINSGKSPARNVEVFCYGGSPKSPEPTWSEISKKEMVQRYAYLLPDRKYRVICDGASLGQLPMPALSHIHYAGVIYYQDEDGRRYQTPFCENVLIATMMNKVIASSDQCVDNSAVLPEIR